MNLVINVLVYQFVYIILLCDKSKAYQFVSTISKYRPKCL